MGGFGSAVLEAANEAGLPTNHVRRLGLPDRYVMHAERDEQLAEVGLDVEGITQAALDLAIATGWAPPEREAGTNGNRPSSAVKPAPNEFWPAMNRSRSVTIEPGYSSAPGIADRHGSGEDSLSVSRDRSRGSAFSIVRSRPTAGPTSSERAVPSAPAHPVGRSDWSSWATGSSPRSIRSPKRWPIRSLRPTGSS